MKLIRFGAVGKEKPVFSSGMEPALMFPDSALTMTKPSSATEA
jgi:hypothetical protein